MAQRAQLPEAAVNRAQASAMSVRVLPNLWPTVAEIHDEIEGVLGRRGEIDEALVDNLREAERAWQEPQE